MDKEKTVNQLYDEIYTNLKSKSNKLNKT